MGADPVKPRRATWSWEGATVFVLALALAVGWVIALLVAVEHPERFNTVGTALLYTIGGALVGAVTSWLGHAERPRHRKDDDRE